MRVGCRFRAAQGFGYFLERGLVDHPQHNGLGLLRRQACDGRQDALDQFLLSVGETRVRRGAKIDSLVQIGHACVVGEDNIICAQTGLAGSSILKKGVLLAGQVGVSGHLTIHDNAVVYAQSGIGHDVPAGAAVSGSPAFDAKEWLRAITAFQKLPEMLRRVRQLEKHFLHD